MLTHDYNKSYPSLQQTYSKSVNVYQIVVVFCIIVYILYLFTYINSKKKIICSISFQLL